MNFFSAPLRYKLLLIVALFALVISTTQVHAAGVPSMMSYQGRLTDASGNLLGGSGTPYYFKFSLWNNTTVGSYSITVAKVEEVVPVKPSPTPEVSVEPINVIEPARVVESIKSPTIIDYPKRLDEGTPSIIGGVTYPNAPVTVSLNDSHDQIFTQVVQSNDMGDFVLLWPHKVDKGEYRLEASVTYNGVKSLPSDALTVSIVPTSATNLKFAIVDYASLILVIIVSLALILALAIYFVHSLRQMKRKLWSDALSAERGIPIEFTKLRNAVKKELAILEVVQTERSLTEEEARLLTKINKHIFSIEKNLNKKFVDGKIDLK